MSDVMHSRERILRRIFLRVSKMYTNSERIFTLDIATLYPGLAGKSPGWSQMRILLYACLKDKSNRLRVHGPGVGESNIANAIVQILRAEDNSLKGHTVGVLSLDDAYHSC